MKNIFFVLILLIFAVIPAYAEETSLSPNLQIQQKSGQIDVLKLNASIKEKGLWEKSWTFVKGKPIDDSLLLGMFSHHTSEHRSEYNESNKLLGLDYKGYSAGTFNNSRRKQTYYAGISRKLYEHNLPANFKFDMKYKLVGLHGYQDSYPDILGITPVIMPMFGISKGYAGADFMIVPDDKPVFVVNFRINLPDLKKKN